MEGQVVVLAMTLQSWAVSIEVVVHPGMFADECVDVESCIGSSDCELRYKGVLEEQEGHNLLCRVPNSQKRLCWTEAPTGLLRMFNIVGGFLSGCFGAMRARLNATHESHSVRRSREVVNPMERKVHR